MFKKCQTNCQADKYLWIRNDTFYFMFELPKQNNKRRYFCKSLHTKNYYEAKEKAKLMAKNVNADSIEAKQLIYTAKSLMDSMIFEEYEEEVESNGRIITEKIKKISSENDPKIVQQFLVIVSKLNKIKMQTLDADDIKILKEISENTYKVNIKELLKHYDIVPKSTPKSDHTIEEIIESMLKKAGNVRKVEENRRALIKRMLKEVGLQITDKYSKFYNETIIQKMCDNIKSANVTGNVKRNHAREIKNLILHANYMDPDTYKTNLINLIPDFKKTRKDERKPHWPYKEDELKQIFNPKQKYFAEHPDVFWTTLIGLFIGARTNAAITLQYGDIINVDGIDCIKFQDTHPIKQLKNDASRRTVPIPQQLLDLGFVKWVQNQKKKLKAKDTDFIFPRCKTESNEFNNKFMTRGFIKYVKSLGIMDNNQNKLDFHSLRKNANLCLESKGVPETFINDIIGWEGVGTRQQSYSNHNLTEIKEQADKLRYDFLQTEFDYWKTIMAKK